MSKNQKASGITNIISYDNSGNISFVSGSTTLMSVSSSGAVLLTNTISGGVATSASLSANSNLLQGTGSVGFATTASLLAVSSSQQQISSSLLTLTASYTALSSSYTALSASYNTFSGSASTRVTQIESVYATTGSNSFRANQSITGSLVVSSTITAQTLVVQTVTSSIVYSSGSNIFGSALTDNQTFTGSLNVSGSNHYLRGNIYINSGSNNSANYLILNKGTSNDGGILLMTSGSNDWQIVNQTGNSDLWFYGYGTNSAAIVLKRSNGYVGIGNTAPTFARLHVSDGTISGSIAIGGTSYPTLLYSTANTGEFRIDNRTSFASGYITFFPNGQGATSGSEAARITERGFLGLGNTAPTTILGVYTSSISSQTVMSEFWNNDYTSGTRNFIRIRNRISAAATISSYFGTGADQKTYIINNDFSRNDIVIDNNGYIGIGTNAPSESFHVHNGNSLIYRGDGGRPSFNIYNNSANNMWQHVVQNSGRYDIRYRSSFNTDPDLTTNAITITNAGKVGIGITNPAVSLDISAKTDALYLAVGSTAQRPTSANGLIRYNTDLQSLETYIANNWVNVQTSANNGYGWRRPSTTNISGVLADGDRTWYSDINSVANYDSVILNHVFTGNFTIVASWQRNYMGLGMLYKSGATLLDFDGYSIDGNGPYFGGASVSGMSSGTYNSYSYLGLYPGPTGSGPIGGTKYYIKWQRSGNSLTMQYNTTGPWSAWTNFSTGNAATCSSGDSVIIGAGQAQITTEVDPLRLIYVIGS